MYIPNLPGNAVVAAIFAIFIVGQLFLGIKHKTWGYMIAAILGLLLEVVGYISRILIHNNPFNGDAFLMGLVTLTIAPAFLTASIYLCLSRIVIVYGEDISLFKPRTYTIVFCTCDIISLVLQALGGGIASSADTKKSSDLGKNIMLAGLLFQVASLALFAVACADFCFRVIKHKANRNPRYTKITSTTLFKAFLVGLLIASITIVIRSIYRCVELWGGFNSELFTGHEATFMILEGGMIIIATFCLTALHPAICFQGVWHEANFGFRTKKVNATKHSLLSDEENPTELTQFQVRR
ncbi:putative sphingoid long-chain base transporter RSB1 [Amylocarpus encephaloides]|uniref:Sphingoid long-chain base transporter RSB1 n=1 Tax=Amylocarpus encephaloides TaxID=45428 RepID=A0A9P8C381_9HELO|nr:putative sphingoid long-chain base transporter RSB1 [Amylocarpus encephaloides]